MIHYRKPRLDEAEAFAALHVQCWREAYAEILPPELMATFSVQSRLQRWLSILGSDERFVLGAYADRVPVGFIISGPSEEKYIPNQDGHLSGLYIAASQHRQGIGRSLLAQGMADWLKHGGATMTVGVLAHNLPARAFYEALGASLVKMGTHDWDGHALPDCLYIWHNLAKIAKV